MAVYTHLNRDQMATFLAPYDRGPLGLADGIRAGVENTNYRVELGGKAFILTLYEKRVDPADLPFFLTLMDAATAAGLRVPSPVRTADGETLRRVADRPAALFTFLPGATIVRPDPFLARAAGAALAQLHLALAGIALRRPNSLGLAGWQRLATGLGDRLERLGAGLTDEIAGALSELADRWPTGLPEGQIHADYFPDNVMVDYGEVSGIIDFYFACTDALAYDVAIAMLAFTPEGQALGREARAFLDGYQSVRPLTAAEWAALPILLAGAAMRFFLTRAHDDLNRVEGSLVDVKDPMVYLAYLRHLRDKGGAFLMER